jgi:hypothetical protein
MQSKIVPSLGCDPVRRWETWILNLEDAPSATWTAAIAAMSASGWELCTVIESSRFVSDPPPPPPPPTSLLSSLFTPPYVAYRTGRNVRTQTAYFKREVAAPPALPSPTPGAPAPVEASSPEKLRRRRRIARSNGRSKITISNSVVIVNEPSRR